MYAKEKMMSLQMKLIKEVEQYQSHLQKYPKGQLHIYKEKRSYKWFAYQKEKKKRDYIPKKQVQLARKLAQKQYYEMKLDEAETELRAIDAYMNTLHSKKNSAHLRALKESEEFWKLAFPLADGIAQNLLEWSAAEYQANPQHRENLTVNTLNGQKVRSKSESIIANELLNRGIPFHYEELLHINDWDYYPDFTIRHPKTGNTIYWEHFGMVDKGEYRHKMVQKIQQYTSNGLIPGVNLILTFETSDSPLDINFVKLLIDYYFG